MVGLTWSSIISIDTNTLCTRASVTLLPINWRGNWLHRSLRKTKKHLSRHFLLLMILKTKMASSSPISKIQTSLQLSLKMARWKNSSWKQIRTPTKRKLVKTSCHLNQWLQLLSIRLELLSLLLRKTLDLEDLKLLSKTKESSRKLDMCLWT